MHRRLVSCHNCVAWRVCPDARGGTLSREEARCVAAACQRPEKGLANETVRVEGQARGLSRKNALRLVLQGHARWLDGGRIERVARR